MGRYFPLSPKTCPYCKETFQPSKRKQETCDKPKCKLAHRKKKRLEKPKQETGKRIAVCPYCQESFTARNAAQITCLKKECVRAREREMERIRNPKKVKIAPLTPDQENKRLKAEVYRLRRELELLKLTTTGDAYHGF